MGIEVLVWVSFWYGFGVGFLKFVFLFLGLGVVGVKLFCGE